MNHAEAETHRRFVEAGYRSYNEMDEYEEYCNLATDGEAGPMTL